jgi:hypothetical protein
MQARLSQHRLANSPLWNSNASCPARSASRSGSRIDLEANGRLHRACATTRNDLMARFILWTVLLLVTTGSVAAQSAKSDLFGFSPGQSFADTFKLAEERRWECHGPSGNSASPPTPPVIRCLTSLGVFDLTFAKDLPSQPLYRIARSWTPEASTENVVQDLSQQYGKTVTSKHKMQRSNNVLRYRWQLDNGLLLDMLPLPNGKEVVVVLFNPDLNLASWRATAVKNGQDPSKIDSHPF